MLMTISLWRYVFDLLDKGAALSAPSKDSPSSRSASFNSPLGSLTLKSTDPFNLKQGGQKARLDPLHSAYRSKPIFNC